uniref:putative disease resistance protein RGA3 n=1 Tax=Fragaria vesca subsp. vesca TaxID=101020 RepID=UPI0005C97758|nr:PREDICTED: putative disease resistance protein RGA3 [Fragaria vesca subsp. vesca]
MAGVLVDVLLERLATLAVDKFVQEMKLVGEVEQEIEDLIRKLRAIQAVLEDAEQRQVTEARVKLWLDELKDVSFDMDDVIDEWITRVEKHLLEKQEKQQKKVEKHQLEKQEKQQKKVCFPFPSSCFRFGQVDYKLFLRREIAVKVKELNERLKKIEENKQSFNFQQNTPRSVPELLQRPKTTSLPNAETFGRDSEKNLLISKLLSESSEESKVPLIIPVVGLGGMGKTYLANLVYNEIKTHFDKSIWVCVSHPFDEIKIAQAIIEELDKDNSSKSSNVLQTLMQCIFDLIKGKKFLLVLDDVWYPKSSQWEEFIKPLSKGAAGSRVLVTTRNEDVATDVMIATTELVTLKGLGEASCLSLFYHSADMVENNVSKEFHDIGLEIVKRCNGLPLAAKTLGSLMRNKKNNIREWRDVLKSKTWELKEVQQDVFRPLLLSYHDLPLPTKQCLLYCVLFPKDYVYDKNNLVELWMSQDYLNDNGSKENMIVGQNYFHDLVMRSFFQDIEKVGEENVNIRCKIHDMVHDFLQYLTKNECLMLDVEMDGRNREKVPYDKIRHFTSMQSTHKDFLEHFLPSCKKLRTLVHSYSDSISIDARVEMIVELKSLRTLILLQWPFKEITETIGGLIHLRYLDLSGNDKLKELPSAVGSLYNLQTLRLDGCWSLTRIDVRRLINLRHLYVADCSLLRLIKGIEKLTHMQRLDWFRVRDGGDEGGNKLEHMTDLNQLQGSLVIDIDRFPSTAENNAAIMKNKAHILVLCLFFTGSEDDQQIMNRLEPHPSLESLTIVRYAGGTFSDWLSSLHSLRVLSLSQCPSCEILPSLGKLASLESLEIRRLHKVSKVGVEFLGIEQGQTSSSSSVFVSFPKLKQLTIIEMESWEEWEGVEEGNSENISIMPYLSHLQISECEKLKALPDFLWKTPLQKLNISGSPILQNLYGQENGEERTKISYIPSIQMQDTNHKACCIC